MNSGQDPKRPEPCEQKKLKFHVVVGVLGLTAAVPIVIGFLVSGSPTASNHHVNETHPTPTYHEKETQSPFAKVAPIEDRRVFAGKVRDYAIVKEEDDSNPGRTLRVVTIVAPGAKNTDDRVATCVHVAKSTARKFNARGVRVVLECDQNAIGMGYLLANVLYSVDGKDWAGDSSQPEWEVSAASEEIQDAAHTRLVLRAMKDFKQRLRQQGRASTDGEFEAFAKRRLPNLPEESIAVLLYSFPEQKPFTYSGEQYETDGSEKPELLNDLQ